MHPNFIDLLRQPSQLLAFGFGSGLAPKAPGTVGTLAAIPLYFLFYDLIWYVQLLIILLAFGFGVYWCHITAKALGVHDHPGIVWDEFVGFWLTMLIYPLVGVEINIYCLILGFCLFRFFDIVKPWPIQWADSKVDGGFGIMLDDVLAGLYSALLIYVTIIVYQFSAASPLF